jgi:putative heme-binding domain-containing protein
VERLLGGRKVDPKQVAMLFARLCEGPSTDPETARQCLSVLTARVQNGELDAHVSALREQLLKRLELRLKSDDPIFLEVALLAASLKDPAGLKAIRFIFEANDRPEAVRQRALDALVAAGDGSCLNTVTTLLADPKTASMVFRAQILAALSKLDDPRVGELVLARYVRMEPELQPRAIELLTQRVAWGKMLLERVAKKEIPAAALNVNQVKKLLAFKDAELSKQVTAVWGTLRETRNPERETVVAEMRTFLRKTPGDPFKGVQVYKNLCAQCHKIHGDGQDVGPDITLNGRADYEQLLSNVFDPSLVIGAAYQATTVLTKKGQVVTGLIVEDNPQRIVLKLQGGKLETIPRSEVEEVTLSKVSLMPEGVEKQLKPQEIADLFAFLVLDKPPSDPKARKIPGAPK